MLISDEDEEGEKAGGLVAARGLAVIGLGISISLDELAVGFSLGLARLPVFIVIAASAAQALIASQAGLYLGARVGERFRESAERPLTRTGAADPDVPARTVRRVIGDIYLSAGRSERSCSLRAAVPAAEPHRDGLTESGSPG